jgi:hypothetical protein
MKPFDFEKQIGKFLFEFGIDSYSMHVSLSKLRMTLFEEPAGEGDALVPIPWEILAFHFTWKFPEL